MKVFLLLASLVLVLGSLGCAGRTPGPIAAGPPPYETAVKDTDTCQPVRKEKIGGDLILCGGKECNRASLTCGTLSSRKKGSTQDWVPISASEDVYDAGQEYRCRCK
jgi:hypothetical protein